MYCLSAPGVSSSWTEHVPDGGWTPPRRPVTVWFDPSGLMGLTRVGVLHRTGRSPGTRLHPFGLRNLDLVLPFPHAGGTGLLHVPRDASRPFLLKPRPDARETTSLPPPGLLPWPYWRTLPFALPDGGVGLGRALWPHARGPDFLEPRAEEMMFLVHRPEGWQIWRFSEIPERLEAAFRGTYHDVLSHNKKPVLLDTPGVLQAFAPDGEHVLLGGWVPVGRVAWGSPPHALWSVATIPALFRLTVRTRGLEVCWLMPPEALALVWAHPPRNAPSIPGAGDSGWRIPRHLSPVGTRVWLVWQRSSSLTPPVRAMLFDVPYGRIWTVPLLDAPHEPLPPWNLRHMRPLVLADRGSLYVLWLPDLEEGRARTMARWRVFLDVLPRDGVGPVKRLVWRVAFDARTPFLPEGFLTSQVGEDEGVGWTKKGRRFFFGRTRAWLDWLHTQQALGEISGAETGVRSWRPVWHDLGTAHGVG